MNSTTKTRLGCESLEVRECPALLVGGDDRCATPWKPPIPKYDGMASVLNPAVTRTIIAINPGTVASPEPTPWVTSPVAAKGLIIAGG